MQLVAYGAQDIYLTGNPQITFFKVVYRRHTNFAIEAIEQVFSGNVDFGKKTTCTISRNGDLLANMYLEVDINPSLLNKQDDGKIPNIDGVDTPMKNISRIGHAMIDYVELEIGGQAIDKQYGEWMDIWTQLTHSREQLEKLNRMISGNLRQGNTDGEIRKLYIPLHFWFNRNPGLALPLIALQYHEVKLSVMFKKSKYVKHPDSTVAPVLKNICLFCDYIFLDTDERRRFAQGSHEYLIEQVQFNGKTSLSPNESSANIELRFNHPCKEIVWLCQSELWSTPESSTYSPFKYCNIEHRDEVKNAVLQLNGHDRFRVRDGTYFRVVQPFQHHTGGHNQSGPILNFAKDDVKGHFYMYSFAIKPEEHQPSGTCNFSRIDNAVLNLDIDTTPLEGKLQSKQVRVYATNYNVLRIMSGMGGLAYSN